MDRAGAVMIGADVPGVYLSDVPARSRRRLATGVPVFLGVASGGPTASSGPAGGVPDWSSATVELASTAELVAHYGTDRDDSHLGPAVRGFFENGGEACYVLRLADHLAFHESLSQALDVLDGTTGTDLVCIPDAGRHGDGPVAAQRAVLSRIDADHRVAILDSRPGDSLQDAVEHWRQLRGASSSGSFAPARNGALYFPWLAVPRDGGGTRAVPPCGHVAGVIARTDRTAGVFKPPANEPLAGVVDLEVDLDAAARRAADPGAGVNCLCAFPGRGIRIWGARTTSGEAAWTYLNVRRLVLTLARWFELLMADVAMEPNGPALWTRIRRDVNDHLFKLFKAGALRGASPQQAYFLKCDEETTPADARERGEVCVMVGVAPLVPAEFIVVRLVGDSAGVRVAGAGEPA
jgi:hypothetical protein